MRQIDEILWSLTGQSPPAQRFLLRRVERQPLTVDAPVLGQELRRLRGGALDGYLRVIEDDFENRRIQDALWRAGGQASGEAGAWTRFYETSGDGPPESTETPDRLERVAVQDLESLVAPLETRLEAEPDRASVLLPVLSRIRLTPSLSVLARHSGSAARDAPVVAALATFGGEAAADVATRVIRRAIERPEAVPDLPAMVAALRHLPGPATLDLLGELVDRTGEIREAVAVALEALPPEEARPLVDRILESREGWATMHCLETMSRAGGENLTERVTRVYRSTHLPLARAVCVQAVGEAGSPRAAGLIQEGLASLEPLVQAAAVEALVRLPEIPLGCLELIRPLVDSPHPKLAMNATLAIALLEPSRAVRRVQRFLSSGSPHDLLKGIHCLAYLNYPPAAGILASVVRKAPRGPMRLQALRALGRRASRRPDAFSELASFLEHDDLDIRASAGLFLADSHAVTRDQAGAAIAHALEREDHELTACLLAEALGLAAAGGDVSQVLARVAAEEDGEVSRSAGLALVRAYPDAAGAEVLEECTDPALRALACLRSWSLGQGPPEALAPLVAEAPRRRLPSVLAVVREATEAAVLTGLAPRRLEPLAERLRGLGSEVAEPRVPIELATGDEAGEAAAPPGGSVGGEGDPGSWWSGRGRRRVERPVTEVRAKGVLGADLTDDEAITAEEVESAVEVVFAKPARELSEAVQRVSYFEPQSGLARWAADRRVRLGAAFLLAAMASLVLVAGDHLRTGLGAPPPEVVGSRPSSDEELLREVAALAVSPTDPARFEARWELLRSWLALDPRHGQGICSSQELDELRRRNRAGDPGAAAELDMWLIAASERLRELRGG